ncbi:ubiquinol-cytochrome C chaperone family protein [Chelatococcus sp. SYSU_G07232]|uniref:Ubiquinol-cytochrome C chaperone family protein n=1 Tax=Chelatococcus albus TaxID=3047466 RepID=A0ABT7AE77_9HYPH|nr:ubiquinol-cytochrome C chaperone family protein [Chelatococcus sp. SYSU_G07232]MDJ1156926.1 ubiquinol-cytochrome C chaperone family protein [Chelatococcus sp. SYSU_G07232]
MILRLFRRDHGGNVVETLYQRTAEASRAPALYAALGVPDTLEGRFEALTLHLFLVLRRLRGLPAPAGDVGQELVDVSFRELERALREIGIGDLSVPKKMKTIAKAFYGRVKSYDEALASEDAGALAETLARNVCGGGAPAFGLAAYVRAAEADLAGFDLEALLAAEAPFPPAARFAGECS